VYAILTALSNPISASIFAQGHDFPCWNAPRGGPPFWQELGGQA